jgi:hypothetical protein
MQDKDYILNSPPFMYTEVCPGFFSSGQILFLKGSRNIFILGNILGKYPDPQVKI